MAFGAFVQEANSNTALTVAFGSNNTAGNLLVVICGEEGTAGSINGISDTQNNPWTLFPQFAGGGHISRAGYVLSCKAGANTVTFTVTGTPSGFAQIAVCEYSGSAALNASNQSLADPSLGIPVTATVGPVLIVGTADDSYSDPWVGTGGYTVRTVSAFALRTSIYDQVFAVPGTYTPILSTPTGGATQFALASLAFVAATAGGASGWVNAQRDFVNLRNT